MKKYKPFFIQQKRLAERLTMEGIEVSPCPNIYDPKALAWKCPLTKEAALIIEEEYTARGKSLPDCVLDVLES